jgi:hypothetical protein
MSITAGIDFIFSESIEPRELISAFDRNRWDFSYEGMPLYLSPADYENMDWVVVDPPTVEHLIGRLRNIQIGEGGFGFAAVHSESGVGGQFIVDKSGKRISWSIGINRPYIGSERLVDYTLCLRAVWEAIGKLEDRLVSIEIMQSI